MKTNYSKTEFLVLTNDDYKVVAIIKIEKGADITNKIIEAISDEYDAEEIKINNYTEFDEYSCVIDINADIIRENAESFTENFKLILTAIY